MNILFYGLGGVGQRHLRNIFRLCENPKIAAIRHTSNSFEIDDNLEVNKKINILEKYNICIYDNLKDAIKEFNPDIAIIATPSNSHGKLALEALKNGIHVFLEKPITTNNKDLDKISKFLKDSNKKLSINYMMRYHPMFVKLRFMINNNLVGKILSAQFTHNSYFPTWHKYEKFQDLYAGKNTLGGGTILTNVHMIDSIYALFGLPKKVFTIGGKISSLKIDVEDTIASLLEYNVNNHLFPVTLNLSFTQKPNVNEIIINGEEGKITLSFDKNDLILIDKNGKEKNFKNNYARNDLFIDCLNDFLTSIKDSSNSDTAFFNVFQGHFLALKIKESLLKKKIINI